MSLILSAAATLLLASSTAADSQLLYLNGAFTTGNGFRRFSQGEQLSYVVGIVDGLKLAPTLGADKPDMKWLRTCIKDMEAEQIKAIVDMFLTDNPDRWHESMHMLVYAALLGPCPRK